MPTGAAPTPVTTADDVVDLFCRAPRARRVLGRWQADPRYRQVVPVVEGHITRKIYEVVPEEVERACRSTDHALGEVKRRIAESVSGVVNWNPEFAFTHVLHHMMEATEEIPRWQDFREYARHDPDGFAMLGSPVAALKAGLERSGHPRSDIEQAIRWRIGNAYYSFLRELWTVTNLRSQGLDIRLHPLADALFRVDAWCGNTALVVYVGNDKFRDGPTGRKAHAESLLAGASPTFVVQHIRLGQAPLFGSVHLPTPEAIAAAAEQISSSNV
ncbi:MAG: hypothetical protein HOV77_09660 [Hamadaea sp.]|uniref:hypothetical protein n=1 Tax=Hamadaea sp. TaxID=2024425 RepID=UPI0017E1DDA6|nr:hypothetical protein [Hamadaea sp.]NUT19442.1 hypothetical protein [Hamadaea sp.]